MTSSTNQPSGGRAGGLGTVSSTSALNSINHRAAASARTRRDMATDRISLVYELLDAHLDTADLAAGFECDERWVAHLDYLRALQRMGRQALAEMSINHEDLRCQTNAPALRPSPFARSRST